MYALRHLYEITRSNEFAARDVGTDPLESVGNYFMVLWMVISWKTAQSHAINMINQLSRMNNNMEEINHDIKTFLTDIQTLLYKYFANC
jgi:hypothetical protein